VEAVEYVVKNEHATDHFKYSDYSGPPSDKNIHAWENLIQPTFFASSPEELELAGESIDDSVMVAGTIGYLTSLGVYHEIHCLRQLRLFLYHDHFYPNMTEANLRYLQGHLDHCLETIRLSLMCNADLGLYTFRWEEDEKDRPKPKSNSERKCVDWTKIEEWSSKRAVPLQPVLLRTTGVAEKIHM
jgi:hypothetical protein